MTVRATREELEAAIESLTGHAPRVGRASWPALEPGYVASVEDRYGVMAHSVPMADPVSALADLLLWVMFRVADPVVRWCAHDAATQIITIRVGHPEYGGGRLIDGLEERLMSSVEYGARWPDRALDLLPSVQAYLAAQALGLKE